MHIAKFLRATLLVGVMFFCIASASLPCVAQVVNAGKTETKVQPTGETVVKTALQYLGARYRRGASSPKGFDCSGFTSYVYKKLNLSLTRSSRQQYTQGVAIKKKSELEKGDLVFFGGSRRSRSVSHVGIVTEVDGNTFKFVHASTSRGVKVDVSTDPYYSRRYIGARRVLGD